MVTDYKKALKGANSEFKNMYNENIGSVYSMLKLILGSGKEVESVSVNIFKNVFPRVLNKEIDSDASLSSALTLEAAKYCHRVLDKKYKAFKIPQNRNYSNISYDKFVFKDSYSIGEIAWESLPYFHRFVYLLNYVYEYKADTIATICKTKEETIQTILHAETTHLERISHLAKERKPDLNSITHDEFRSELLKLKMNAKAPEAIRNAVDDYIDKICAPIKAREKKKKIKISVIAICIVIIVGIVGGFAIHHFNKTKMTSAKIGEADGSTDITVTDDTDAQNTSTGAEINEEITNYADIEIENYGTVTVALKGNAAPKTVANFVKLANEGFYDGLTFHRIMDGFMMQGGDPNGDGTGGSDENVVGEFSENGFENPISHTRGTISMARSGDPDSGSSQFFIVHEDSTFLDGQYAAFGNVTEGMDIVDKICTSAAPTDDNGTIPKDQQPIITSVKIR